MSSKEDISTIHVLTMYKCFDIDFNKTYQNKGKDILHSELVHFFIGLNDIELTLNVIKKLDIKENDKQAFLDKINTIKTIKTNKKSDIIEQGVRSFFNDYNRDATAVFPSVAQSGIKANGGSTKNIRNVRNVRNVKRRNKQKGGTNKNTDLIKLLAESIKETIKGQLSFIQGRSENNDIYARLLLEITEYCNNIDIDFELDKFRLSIKNNLIQVINIGEGLSTTKKKDTLMKDVLEKVLKRNVLDVYFTNDDDTDSYKHSTFRYNNENVRIILKYVVNSIIKDDIFEGMSITDYTHTCMQGLMVVTNTIIEVVEFAEVFALPSLLINVILKRDIADLYALHYRLYKYNNGLDISLFSRCLLPLLDDIKIYNEEKVPFYGFDEIIARNTNGNDKRKNFMNRMKTILERFLTKVKYPIDRNKISILSTYFGCELKLITRQESMIHSYIDCISENILNIIILMNQNGIGNFDNVEEYVEEEMAVETTYIERINDPDEKNVATLDITNSLPCTYNPNGNDDDDDDDDDETKINAYYRKIFYYILFLNKNLECVHSRDSDPYLSSVPGSVVQSIEIEKEPQILINGSMIFTSTDIKMINEISGMKGIRTQFIYLYADYHRYICLLLFNNDNNDKFEIGRIGRLGHDGQSIIAFIKNPDEYFFKFETKTLKEAVDKLKYIECLYLFMRMYGIPIPAGDGIINYIYTRQSMFLITGESINSWDNFTHNNAKIGEFTIITNTDDNNDNGNNNNNGNLGNDLDKNINMLRKEILDTLEKLKTSRKRDREGGGFKKKGGKKYNEGGRVIKSLVRKELINRSMRDIYKIKGRGNTLFLDINKKKYVRYTNFMKEMKEMKGMKERKK